MGEPVRIGPQGWPERTLYLPIALWSTRWLRQPDGPDAGDPWRFTDQQARTVAWWYAIDENGRWLHRRGTIRLCKGAGKDPLAAVLSAVEFAGPCRFGGWAEDGSPIAMQYASPWIQIAATSREQTRTTMRLFSGLFSPGAVSEFGIEINKGIIYGRGGQAVIESVTSSPLALEGPRATLTIRNEVQNWKSSNAGHEMAEVIDGNMAKSRDGGARALSLCNAHVPGEDSVAEREWDAYQQMEAGNTRRRDVLYVAVEAPADTVLADEDSLRRGLEAARGDSTWLDVDRLIGEIYDPKTTPSEARRKYLNQVVAAEDAWADPQQWDAMADATLVLADRELVALGFDGSTSDDHCALVATRISDGAWFTLGVWDPGMYGGEAPRLEIDLAVQRARERLDVVAFYSDLHPWESYVDKWFEDFETRHRQNQSALCVWATTKHPIAFDMRTRGREFTLEGAERLEAEIKAGTFAHDGHKATRAHVHNARRRPNQHGVSFGKEHRESAKKVDALAAGVLSRMARRAYLALAPIKQRRQRTGKAAF